MSVWKQLAEALGPTKPDENRPDHRMDSKKTSDQSEYERRKREDDAKFSDVDEGPVDVPGLDIGAGVKTQFGQAGSQQIKLTIGGRQMIFSPEEFVEMINSGQLQRMVGSGKVRKLPGVG